MSLHIPVDQERIAAFCRGHHILRLAFFGSVLRDDFRADSDVDVLVEFEPGLPYGYFHIFSLQDRLAELLGNRVDLVTLNGLRSEVRDEVVREAVRAA